MNRALERTGNLQTFGKLSEKRNVFRACAYDVVKGQWLFSAIVAPAFLENSTLYGSAKRKTAPPPQPALRMRRKAAERAATPLSRGVSAIVGREMWGAGDAGARSGKLA